MPRGLIHVAGSKRCVLSHPGSPPSQTILEICIWRGGISISLSPLRQMRIRILNYLDDWLILAQSQAVLTWHKTLFLSHLRCPGLKVNFAKNILSPSQRVSFLGTVIDNSAPRGCPSAQSFPENAGPYGSGFAGTSVCFCFTCDLSSSDWSRGFHPRLGVTDATA